MFKKRRIAAKLDGEILSALEELGNHDETSEEYRKIIERIVTLEKLQPNTGMQPLKMDTVLLVAANIFGIVWLARYEKENVIRSQSALRFVMKP
jgi:hypothetical protein